MIINSEPKIIAERLVEPAQIRYATLITYDARTSHTITVPGDSVKRSIIVRSVGVYGICQVIQLVAE